MKKVLSILFSVVLIFLLVSCQISDDSKNEDKVKDSEKETKKDSTTEPKESNEPATMQQVFAEYDNIDFDFNAYFDEMRAQGKSVTSMPLDSSVPYNEHLTESYIVMPTRGVFFTMYFANDVEVAKEFYHYVIQDFLAGTMLACIPASVIRVDNTVILAHHSEEWSANGASLAELMNSMGIPVREPIEVNPKTSAVRIDTQIPIESIINNMETEGYKLICSDIQYEYDQSASYTFWSEEGKSIDIIVVKNDANGNNTQNTIYTKISELIEYYLSEFCYHTRIIYSINDEYGMLFMGNATDVDELWNSVKQ